MPKVTFNGKLKKLPYTQSGKKMYKQFQKFGKQIKKSLPKVTDPKFRKPKPGVQRRLQPIKKAQKGVVSALKKVTRTLR